MKKVLKIPGILTGVLMLLAAMFLFGCIRMTTAVHAQDLPNLHASANFVEVTDLGGKYKVRGTSQGITASYVYFDGIQVPDDGKIYLSLDLIEYPFSENVDTWLSFMVGSDQGIQPYGPNTVYSGNVGPYYSQLMRISESGTVKGDYFIEGVVKGSFDPIESTSLEICLAYSGNNVQVFINGKQVQTFTARDAETCNISFVQYSAVSSNIYEYDLSVERKTMGTDVDYDLALGESRVTVPLKTMGTEFEGLQRIDGTILQEGVDYTLEAGVGGLQNILLQSSLMGAAEGDKTEFIVASTGGESSFTVTTTDTSVVTAEDAAFDKASPSDLSVGLKKGNLSDITIRDEDEEYVDDAVIHDTTLTFPSAYFENVDYGQYRFSLCGKKQSGDLSQATWFTVTVYDSRLPQFSSAEIEVDAAFMNEDVKIGFQLYDARILKVLANGKKVAVDDYSLESESFVLKGIFAETVLEYGENTITVITDKNEVSIILRKKDSRTPSVAENYLYDISSDAEYYTFESDWYAQTPTSVVLNGEEIAAENWLFTLRGIRIKTEILKELGTGKVSGSFFAEEEYVFTLEIVDLSAPKISSVHHYDVADENDAEIVFSMNGCNYLQTLYKGLSFPAAHFDGDTLSISAAWFAEKLNAGILSVGDSLVFDVVWSSEFVEADLHSVITVLITDSDGVLAQLKDFDKKSESDFLIPVFLNGYRLLSLQVNDSYTSLYSQTDEGILLSNAFVRSLPVGALKFIITTEEGRIFCSNTLSDTRSIKVMGNSVFYSGEDYEDGFLVQIEMYENEVYMLSDWEGKTIAAYNYSVTEQGIVFDSNWLQTLGGGYFNCTITTQRRENGMIVQEKAEMTFYIQDSAEAVLEYDENYDLSSGKDVTVAAEFAAEGAPRILYGGKYVEEFYFSRTGKNEIILRNALFETIGTGSHTLILECGNSKASLVFEITDSRINNLSLEELSVNAGERELVFYGEFPNANFTILVDGQLLDKDAFRVEGNYLVLNASFVKGLGAGQHELQMQTDGGTDSLLLNILADSVSYVVPVVVSLAGAAVVFVGISVGVFFTIGRKRREK